MSIKKNIAVYSLSVFMALIFAYYAFITSYSFVVWDLGLDRYNSHLGFFSFERIGFFSSETRFLFYVVLLLGFCVGVVKARKISMATLSVKKLKLKLIDYSLTLFVSFIAFSFITAIFCLGSAFINWDQELIFALFSFDNNNAFYHIGDFFRFIYVFIILIVLLSIWESASKENMDADPLKKLD